MGKASRKKKQNISPDLLCPSCRRRARKQVQNGPGSISRKRGLIRTTETHYLYCARCIDDKTRTNLGKMTCMREIDWQAYGALIEQELSKYDN